MQKQQRLIEILVGLFLLLGVLALLYLALQVSGLSANSLTQKRGYEVTASFDNIGDLKARAPITIGGVRIGQVERITLDPNSFKAVVLMTIDDRSMQIPDDSQASIYTAGLLGSNYIELTPGFDTESLHQGSLITQTHSALVLENLIGQLVYKMGGNSDSSDNKTTEAKSST